MRVDPIARPRRNRPARGIEPGSATWLDRLALLSFVLTCILSFSAVKLGMGGLPFRVLTLFGALGLLILSDPGQFIDSLRRFRRALLVVLFAAILGSIVSLAYRTPPAALVTQLIEIHLQAAIGVTVAGTLALRLGIKAVAVALLIAFGITAAVALAQALGVGPAWNIRAWMGGITGDPPITRLPYETRERAMGMSFSPVVFGTQACLILAMLLVMRLARPGSGRSFDWGVIGVCAVFGILCIATGNRSPLLGVVIFLGTYLAITKPRLSLVLIPAFGGLIMLAQPLFEQVQESGVRAVRSDSSSENRGTLRAFGMRLLAERPIGYGLDFNSTVYANEHVSELKYMSSPEAIRQWTLHNYYLVVLCKYGLLLLLLIPAVLPRSWLQAKAWWAFVPYMCHIYYHNDGPLQGDFIIFFIVPIAMLLTGREPGPALRPRRWQRSLESAPA